MEKKMENEMDTGGNIGIKASTRQQTDTSGKHPEECCERNCTVEQVQVKGGVW